jgi:hypothetical protein
MDLKKTIDLIIKDLTETRNIIDDLKNYPDVPLFQIELAKSKCKSAEDLIALLKGFEEIKTTESFHSVIIRETDKVEERIEELIEIDLKEDNDVQIIEPQQPIAPLKSEKAILSDRFRIESGNINEKIGKRKGVGDVNSMIRSKYITNLADAIGINDKFYFIREIFSGNHASYDEAIKKLNSVQEIDDARAVIMSYTGDSNENNAISQLIELVKIKISSNG